MHRQNASVPWAILSPPFLPRQLSLEDLSYSPGFSSHLHIQDGTPASSHDTKKDRNFHPPVNNENPGNIYETMALHTLDNRQSRLVITERRDTNEMSCKLLPGEIFRVAQRGPTGLLKLRIQGSQDD